MLYPCPRKKHFYKTLWTVGSQANRSETSDGRCCIPYISIFHPLAGSQHPSFKTALVPAQRLSMLSESLTLQACRSLDVQ